VIYDDSPGSSPWEPKPLYQGSDIQHASDDCSEYDNLVTDPPSGMCDFVDGSYDVQQYCELWGCYQVYRVGPEEFDNFLGSPHCFGVESGRIKWDAGHQAPSSFYYFDEVASGTFLYRLGIRTGDIPLEIHEHDGQSVVSSWTLFDVEEAFDAFDHLRTSTNEMFIFDVNRGGVTVSLGYVIAESW
jgi:hypothetical protein